MRRLGLSVTTVVADLTDWSPAEQFDAILLDAPCSATGTIRRHPDVARLKTPDDITVLADLQRRILARAADWLKPGGLLVYCTCSLEPEEGEVQIARFLEGTPDFRRIPILASDIGGDEAMVRADGDLRTLPGHLVLSEPRLSGLDGFFAARLQRIGMNVPQRPGLSGSL
jgi:16S rRNA (cytosine967-C5)-methyltransferase